MATALSTAHEIERRAALADAIIGAVLVDVAIDQGGCFETSRATTYADPVFIVDGITHYCVANTPGTVPRTSSFALGNTTLPSGLALADKGLDALGVDPHLARASTSSAAN